MKRKGIDVDEPPPKRRKTRESDKPVFDLQDPLVRLCLELVKADESEIEDIFKKIRKIKKQPSETAEKPLVNISLMGSLNLIRSRVSIRPRFQRNIFSLTVFLIELEKSFEWRV